MLKNVSYIILLYLLFCFNLNTIVAQPQEYPIRLFTKEAGLRYDFKSMLQDKQGFIWIRYRDEIQRFDGKNIDSFLKGEWCHSLILDSSGVVWVSSGKHIFKFNTNNLTFEKIDVLPKTDNVKILLKPYNNTIQCISNSGIYRYDKAHRQFVFDESENYALDASLRLRWEYVSNFNHILFYKVKDSICRHNLKNGRKSYEYFFEIRNVLAQSQDEYIVNNWESKAWYYNTRSKLKRRISLNKNEPSLIVFDAKSANKHTSYLVTSKGLLEYSVKNDILKPIKLSINGVDFPVQRYNSIYKGKEDKVWVTTGSSLMYFKNNANNFYFVHGDYEAEQFTTDVRRFVADDSENLWLATSNGLVHWDLKQHTFTTIYAEENATNKLNHPSIRGLVYDGTHLIIGQTNKGIWLYNPNTKVFKRPSFENSKTGNALRKKSELDFVNDIKTLKNGNHLICARDGAYIMDGTTYQINNVDFPGENMNVKFSYEDTKGNIFIGTMGGLFCLDSNLNFKYQLNKELNHPATFDMLETIAGYYIGTMKGVYFFSAEAHKISLKSIIPELEQEWIRTIFQDKNQNIWFVSESDIHRYNPKTTVVNTFGFTENVLGDFFHRDSYYRDDNGRVYIGGTNGINYFYPEQIRQYSKPLHPYIKSIQIPTIEAVLPNTTSPILAHDDNSLQIEVSTPYFGNHNDIYYRYQLSENSEWFDLGNSTNMNLRSLAPGNYNLSIAASLDNKEWYQSKSVFNFTIRPPFWKRSWFIIAMLIGLGFTVYKLYTSFRRKLETEQLLNGFATSLYGQSTVDEILWDTARYCVQKLNFIDCIIYLIDAKRNVLLQKAAFGIKNPYGKEIINKLEISIEEGIVGSVAKSAKPELVRDTENDKRYILDSEKALSEITVPIMVDGKVFAILDSEHPKRNFYKQYHLKLLKKIAAICSERLTKYLSQENLRSEIARDLHDEMGSTLTSIHITSKMAEQDVKDNPIIKKQFSQINKHTTNMMDKMSDMVWVVNPANDSLDKLIYRIKEYAIETLEPAGMNIKFKDLNSAEDIKINTAQRKNIYLIAKESINNIVKHSKASKVEVLFKKEDEHLLICINDNGVGFDTTKTYKGNGLRNLHSRAEEVNAHLTLESDGKSHTAVCLKMKTEELQSGDKL